MVNYSKNKTLTDYRNIFVINVSTLLYKHENYIRGLLYTNETGKILKICKFCTISCIKMVAKLYAIFVNLSE